MRVKKSHSIDQEQAVAWALRDILSQMYMHSLSFRFTFMLHLRVVSDCNAFLDPTVGFLLPDRRIKDNSFIMSMV